MKDSTKEKINNFFNKNYKKILIVPAVILLICTVFMVSFYNQNGDLIKKDITLTGGTSIQITSNTSISALEKVLDEKFGDVSIRQVSNILTGEQVAFIVETKLKPEEITPFLEEYLGFKLDDKNSSIEFTGSTIAGDSYTQLILAVIFSFLFMGAVLFFIFSDNLKMKLLVIFLASLVPVLFFMLRIIPINLAFILSFVFLVISSLIYIKYSIPAFLIMICAFADLFMTLSVVNLIGMELSTAGIVAFMMLIGYSVDTDILLTTRVLKRKGGGINSRIFSSFKTGITMTLTSLSVVLIGLLITSSFSEVFFQLFFIIAIGLSTDILNTWVTNVCLIKWYTEKNKID
ncbi:MAG TPA: hypothetical protein P5277_03355 [Candidatus Paceibacterota bacterium]|nr:hypothetical protein [Candidatus Paceibacterota bacterium]